MALQAIPGATYEYQEYPAMRYNPDSRTRTIRSETEEEEGWYDSPTKANAESKKLADAISAKNQAEKEAARKAKTEDAIPTKQEVTRMKVDALMLLASKLGLEIPPETKRGDLIKMINANLDKPQGAEATDESAGSEDKPQE
jgi:hypothetical protein